MGPRPRETAVNERKDIVLVVDYHSENIEFRWFNEATGEERTGKYSTSRDGILRQVEEAAGELEPGGKVVWIMESTTGWARVKDLLGERVKFVLLNVLQMPRSPKSHRRKNDKIDTGRALREYLCGKLPQSFQPAAWWRQVRRVVDCRQGLVERQTAVKNWISALLHQETWEDRGNLWSGPGRLRLANLELPPSDRMLLNLKLGELDSLAERIGQVEAAMREIYDSWADAQRVDAIRGVGMVTAVSVLAHIGPIERFPTAEHLIAYAGLAPGLRESDDKRRHGKIGGGGTDSHLRYLAIEATPWLSEIPRYRATYDRVAGKRGVKIARIVLARLLLRSIHKMLRDKVGFNPAPAAASASLPSSKIAFIACGLPAAKAASKRGAVKSKEKARRCGRASSAV
jgi:transposase